MTIDEAIAQEKELAKKIYMQGMLCHANPDDGKLDGYIESGKEHEQIAEWLEDYKFIKQWKSDIMDSFCKYDVSSFEELVTNVRNKTIDDFVNLVKMRGWNIRNRNENSFIYGAIDKLAEKLKEQK